MRLAEDWRSFPVKVKTFGDSVSVASGRTSDGGGAGGKTTDGGGAGGRISSGTVLIIVGATVTNGVVDGVTVGGINFGDLFKEATDPRKNGRVGAGDFTKAGEGAGDSAREVDRAGVGDLVTEAASIGTARPTTFGIVPVAVEVTVVMMEESVPVEIVKDDIEDVGGGFSCTLFKFNSGD